MPARSRADVEDAAERLSSGRPAHATGTVASMPTLAQGARPRRPTQRPVDPPAPADKSLYGWSSPKSTARWVILRQRRCKLAFNFKAKLLCSS